MTKLIAFEDLEKGFKDASIEKKGGCCVCCCTPFLVGFIILMCSINSLGPEDQLVIVTDGGTGKEVVNGPGTSMVSPFRATEKRQATRLTPQQYAVVKNIRTGVPRIEAGPMLLFPGAWDDIQAVKSKIVLQAREYTRLVDSFTGQIRIEVGPQRVVPDIFETAPQGTQRAYAVKSTQYVLVMNQTSGKKRVERPEGFFIPAPFEQVVDVMNSTILKQKDYAIVRDSLTGEYRHEPGSSALFPGAYDEVVKVSPKIVLQKMEYVRLVDTFTGFARVVTGPTLMVPNPAEDGPGGINHRVQKAIIISSQVSVILFNKTSGKKYEHRTEGMFVPGPYEDIVEVRNATVVRSQEYAVVKNELSGKYIHYGGPTQLFVNAYEILVNVFPKVVLQKQEYVRLVDRRSGEEVVLKGPQAVVPEPMQCEKDYTKRCVMSIQKAIVMKATVTVLTLNRTSGVREIQNASVGGIYTPEAMIDIVEVRNATVLPEQEYAVVKNVMTGKYIHYGGPLLLFVKAYEQLVTVIPKIVLQKQEYIRLVDRRTGEESVVSGPQAVVPEPTQCEKEYTLKCNIEVHRAVIMKATLTVLTLNRTSGVKNIHSSDSGGIYTPGPMIDIVEIRNATVLKQQDYAIVKNTLSGTFSHVQGPVLLHLQAYEELDRVALKVVLHRFQYLRLVNELTGTETIVEGPAVVVPDPNEVSVKKDDTQTKVHAEGVQDAMLIDTDHAVLLVNQATGEQQLNSTAGMWIPRPYEHLIEMRPLIRVLANEAVIVRDYQGALTIHDGTQGGAGTAFFLQPRTQVVSMTWSAYSMPDANGSSVVSREVKEKIDMRIQRTFYSYVVRTNDNVELMLMGTVFWRISNVSRMILGTSDPSGDVWHHSRSSFMQAVSNVSFDNFMGTFNTLAKTAYERDLLDGFYAERGVTLLSMEVTRFEAVDEETKATLRQINEETTNQITLLKKQEGENAVKAAKMRSDIALEEEQTTAQLALEGHKTSLIETRNSNNLLEQKAAAEGAAQPYAQKARTFINELNSTGVSILDGLTMYKTLQQSEHHNTDTANLAGGKATLFLTSNDVGLNFQHLNVGMNGTSQTPGGGFFSGRRLGEMTGSAHEM